MTRAGSLPVRPASAEDFDAAYALYRELSPRAPLAPRDAARRHWAAILSHPGTTVFGVHDQELVAMATLHLMPNIPRQGRPYGILENVVVAKAWRGQGLGRRVVRAALAHAEARDACRVTLQTHDARGVVGFYLRLGFADSHHGMQVRWDWNRGAT